ncbi:MAG: hypothetical protein WCJ29_01560 [bacterium]
MAERGEQHPGLERIAEAEKAQNELIRATSRLGERFVLLKNNIGKGFSDAEYRAGVAELNAEIAGVVEAMKKLSNNYSSEFNKLIDTRDEDREVRWEADKFLSRLKLRAERLKESASGIQGGKEIIVQLDGLAKTATAAVEKLAYRYVSLIRAPIDEEIREKRRQEAWRAEKEAEEARRIEELKAQAVRREFEAKRAAERAVVEAKKALELEEQNKLRKERDILKQERREKWESQQRLIAEQEEKEKAERDRKQKELAEQEEREAAERAQKEKELAEQREREDAEAARKEKELAEQRAREAFEQAQKEKELEVQKEKGRLEQLRRQLAGTHEGRLSIINAERTSVVVRGGKGLENWISSNNDLSPEGFDENNFQKVIATEKELRDLDRKEVEELAGRAEELIAKIEAGDPEKIGGFLDRLNQIRLEVSKTRKGAREALSALEVNLDFIEKLRPVLTHSREYIDGLAKLRVEVHEQSKKSVLRRDLSHVFGVDKIKDYEEAHENEEIDDPRFPGLKMTRRVLEKSLGTETKLVTHEKEVLESNIFHVRELIRELEKIDTGLNPGAEKSPDSTVARRRDTRTPEQTLKWVSDMQAGLEKEVATLTKKLKEARFYPQRRINFVTVEQGQMPTNLEILQEMNEGNYISQLKNKEDLCKARGYILYASEAAAKAEMILDSLKSKLSSEDPDFAQKAENIEVRRQRIKELLELSKISFQNAVKEFNEYYRLELISQNPDELLMHYKSQHLNIKDQARRDNEEIVSDPENPLNRYTRNELSRLSHMTRNMANQALEHMDSLTLDILEKLRELENEQKPKSVQNRETNPDAIWRKQFAELASNLQLVEKMGESDESLQGILAAFQSVEKRVEALPDGPERREYRADLYNFANNIVERAKDVETLRSNIQKHQNERGQPSEDYKAYGTRTITEDIGREMEALTNGMQIMKSYVYERQQLPQSVAVLRKLVSAFKDFARELKFEGSSLKRAA